MVMAPSATNSESPLIDQRQRALCNERKACNMEIGITARSAARRREMRRAAFAGLPFKGTMGNSGRGSRKAAHENGHYEE